MFLTQITQFKRLEFWRYVLGFIIIAAFYMLGQIPLTIAWLVKKGSLANLQDTPQRDLMNILNENTTLFFALLMFGITLFGIIIVLKYIHKQTFKSLVTARPKLDWGRIFFSFLILSIVVIGSTLFDYNQNPQDYEWNFQWKPFLILAIISVLMIPIQTSVEEFIFRGYLMQGFAYLSKQRFVALVFTSVIFGAMHLANPEIQELGYYALIFYIGTGFFLGILTLMDNGMELALGFHAANNLITALLVTADYTVLQTPSILKQISTPTIGFSIIMPVLILYPILLLIFAKKYNWTNWKQRLLGSL